MKKFKDIDDTKGDIIYAAIQLIPEKGYEKTSMREIAEKAEVTKPAVYYYFDNKKELFKEMMDIGHENILIKLEEIISSDDTFKKKLIQIILLRFRVFPDEPAVEKFISWAFTEGMKYVIDITHSPGDHESKYKEIICNLIKEEKQKGNFKKDINIEHLFGLILGATNYYTRQYFLGEREQLSKQEAKEIVDIIFYGIHKNN